MTNSSPINTALLSYGMSGEVFHGPLLAAHPGFQIGTILERSKDRARLRYPQARIVRTLDEVLQDDAIELVVVNTPHDTHFELTSAVLRAGKHAIVEKPFANTVAEGKALIALARESGRMLSVFQNRRWDGDFLTVQHVVRAGWLGRIVEMEAHYDRYRPEVDLTTWKEGAGPGSGILFNLGAHMIDQALVLFGRPQSLQATVGIQRLGGKSDDSYTIRLIYEGHHVLLRSSYLVREAGPRYIVHGEKGSFVKYGLDPQEQALKDGHAPGRPGWGTESREWWGKINTQLEQLHLEGKIETLPGNYLAFYDGIHEALRSGTAPAVAAEQSLMVIEVIEAAMESSRSGRVIDLP